MFTFSGGVTLSSQGQGASMTKALNSVGATADVLLTDGDLSGAGFGVSGAFKVFGIDVKTDGDNPLGFIYDTVSKQFEVAGGVTVSVGTDTSFDINLGHSLPTPTPGLIIKDGTLTLFEATVTGNAKIGPVQVTPDNLTFHYDTTMGAEDFKMFGSLQITVGANAIKAILGTSDMPGLVLGKTAGGSWDIDSFDVALSDTFTIGGLTVKVDDAGAEFVKADRTLSVFGSVEVVTLFSAKASFGTDADPGLVIRDGKFQLADFEFQAQQVNFGVFTIQDFDVKYTEAAAQPDGVEVSVALMLAFPGGFAVGGAITIVNGKVDDISVDYTVTTGEGIPVGDTGLFITRMAATVTNIDQPSNLTVSGSMAVNYGAQVPLAGKTVSIFRADGSFFVDKDELVLSADAYLGAYSTGSGYAGLLGGGKATVTLDWGDHTYKADVQVELYDNLIQIDASFFFQDQGDESSLVIKADAKVAIPTFVPFVGGTTLAGLDFVFDYHTMNGVGLGYVAAWIEFDVIEKFDVGILVDLGDSDHAVKVIGTGTVKQIDSGTYVPPVKEHVYSGVIQVPAGATSANFEVEWPFRKGNQSVGYEFVPTGGTIGSNIIYQAAFGGTANPDASIAPQLSGPLASTTRIVGSAADPNTPLNTAGTYYYYLRSTEGFDAKQVAFSATYSFARPTVAVAAPPANSTAATITEAVSWSVDGAYLPNTTISLFVDDRPSGYGGTQIGRFTPGADAGSMPLPVDLTKFDGRTHYFYASISDGVNATAFSAYSAAITAVGPIFGVAYDAQNQVLVEGVLAYIDANGDGIYNAPILDQSGNVVTPGDPGTVTGTDGYFRFDYIDPRAKIPLVRGATYPIGLVTIPGVAFEKGAPPGQALSSPQPFVVPIDPSASVTYGFLLKVSPSVSGAVFIDTNQNGTIDPLDRGAQGWAVTISGPSGVVATVATGSDGTYRVINLAPSTAYTVTLVPNAATQSDFITTGPITRRVTTNTDPNELIRGQDFGVLQLATIRGKVSNDAIEGGALSGTPGPPSAGSTVQLVDSGGQVIATTTASTVDGSYAFAGVRPSLPGTSYSVRQVVQPGWRQVAPFTSELGFSQSTADVGQPVPSFDSGDFNGDGFDDLASIPAGQGIVLVQYGNGRGGFMSTFNYAIPFDDALFIRTIRDEGVLPGVIVVSQFGRNISLSNTNVAPGNEADQFTSPVPGPDIPYGPRVIAAATGDFDNDGLADLVLSVANVGSDHSGGVFVRLRRGGPFNNDRIDQAKPGAVAVGDVNGDGNLDVVMNGGRSKEEFTIGYGRGNCSLNLVYVQLSPSGFDLHTGGAIAVGDVNGDGLPDVLAAALFGDKPEEVTTDYLGVYLQNSGGVFIDSNFLDLSSAGVDNIYALTTSDLDGDLIGDLTVLADDGGLPAQSVIVTLPSGTEVGNDIFTRTRKITQVPGGVYNLAEGHFTGKALTDLVTGLFNASGLTLLTNTSTIDQSISVPLSSGQFAILTGFVNAEIGQVAGTVFDDIDASGTRAAGERAIAGQVIYLDLNGNGRRDPDEPSRTTGPQGAYAFSGLAPGRYRVRVDLAADRLQTVVPGDAYFVTVGPSGQDVNGEFGSSSRFLPLVADQAVVRGNRLSVSAAPENSASPLALRYRLGPGAPAGSAVDPITGLFTFTPTRASVSAVYEVTVLASPLGNPVADDSTTFRVRVVAPVELPPIVVAPVDPPPAISLGPDDFAAPRVTFRRSGRAGIATGSPATGATVDYGDGSGPVPLALAADGSFTLAHAYRRLGAFTITVKVANARGESVDSLTVRVVSRIARRRIEFVRVLYREILGRSPTEPELIQGVRSLRSGIAPARLAYKLAHSGEAVYLHGRALGRAAWTAMLRRAKHATIGLALESS